MTAAAFHDSWQRSLFDGDSGESWGLDGLTRRELGQGAWIDIHPAWLPDAEGLFDHLLREVPWHAEERKMYDRVLPVPRLLAWYRFPDSPHPTITHAAEVLSTHYAERGYDPFASAGMCLYRDGNDSVAWHGDRTGRSQLEDTVIGILSLGNPRALSVRPRGGGASQKFQLGNGDLLVMGGTCQRTWDHAVLKTTAVVGPRISVQLRPAGVA